MLFRDAALHRLRLLLVVREKPWPAALLSGRRGLGEAGTRDASHNLHHADPSARHDVDRGQFDLSAAVIHLLERLGWVYDVRWPTAERVAARREPDVNHSTSYGS